MEKNPNSLPTQEQISVENFAKCASYLRKELDSNQLLNDCPEAKEVIFQKYLSIAKSLCQAFRVMNPEILRMFGEIINGTAYELKK